jgi:hypothetical protein
MCRQALAVALPTRSAAALHRYLWERLRLAIALPIYAIALVLNHASDLLGDLDSRRRLAREPNDALLVLSISGTDV